MPTEIQLDPLLPLLKDWNVIPTWTFADFPDGKAIWKLTDFSNPKNTNVTMTIMDNEALSKQLGLDPPLGMTANNPTKEGLDVIYDGIIVPHIVKDDYLYRNPDTKGTEMLFRFANLSPGTYKVTLFLGRTTDNDGQFGKIWVDDISGKKEPTDQNTGDFGGKNISTGQVLPLGQLRTITVDIKAGDFLWYAHMEDNTGGTSGMIIQSVTPVTPPPSSSGLFKLDFGQLENERIPTDADGNPTGPAPAPLKDWNVIPTWTFADFPDGKAIWKLTDFSNPNNTNVTMTITDNEALSKQVGLDPPLGMTANNPTKEGLEVTYDGVKVPAIVKDDYLYRNPDTKGTEMLFRFANLTPGTYNVTLFMGRTSDSDGQFGKIWVDDINGKKEPTDQNTGDFGARDLASGIPIPQGQPRTITVDIKAGDFLWYAHMEDNTGGISGMIIRGITSTIPSVELLVSSTVTGAFTTASDAQIDSANKSIKVKTTGSARFFRVKGSAKITSASASKGVIEIKYQ